LIGVIYFFVVRHISVLATVVGLVLFFLMFWLTPRKAVKMNCNRLIASSIDKLDHTVDRNHILMSLVQLMKDLETNNLSGKHTADRSDFKRIKFVTVCDRKLDIFEYLG